MDINEELIRKWEPKIQRMLSVWFVPGMTKEDLAQELRIAIIKAAKAYRSDASTIFHTYLHRTMVNTIITLISKQNKSRVICSSCGKSNTKQVKKCVLCKELLPKESPTAMSFEQLGNGAMIPFSSPRVWTTNGNTENMFADEVATYEQVEIDAWLDSQKLEPKERAFISLRLYGLTMEEITEDLGESAYKIRQSLREKIQL